MTSSSHSQAHLQFTRANSKTKNCKRVCLLSYAFLPTLKTKSGQCKLENDVTQMKRRKRLAGYFNTIPKCQIAFKE